MEKKFLKPEDIRNVGFREARSGYDMLAVDCFLEQVEASISEYYKENAELKSKMKVLVEHIEKLRGSDNEAVISAYKKENTELKSKMKVLVDALEQYRHTNGKNIGSRKQPFASEDEEWLFDVTKF